MDNLLKIILPKGRIQEDVMAILARIGISFHADARSLRPSCNDAEIEAKILKPQNIPTLVALGRHDCGFTGHDWIVEQKADVVEIMDLGFNQVRIVAAVPEDKVADDKWASSRCVVASEYRSLAESFIKSRGLDDAVFVRSYGATEALPPEDADLVIDNTETGATLRQHRLVIVDEIMVSTTRFICNKAALADPWKRGKIDEITMLLQSTLNALEKVLLEMNVAHDSLDGLVEGLPCMRAPTVAPLHHGDGYAVKVAVPRKEVPQLIPLLIERGARDILEYKLEKIVT